MFSKLFRRLKGPGGEPEPRPQPTAAGPRRREHERFACRLPIRARCSSWDSFHDLFSGNVSRRGLFIPSEELPALGESVELQLVAPDGRPLPLRGRVVHLFEGGEGKPRGLGVELEGLPDEHEQLYRSLVEEAARQLRVRPATESLAEPGPEPAAGAPAGGLFGTGEPRPERQQRPGNPFFDPDAPRARIEGEGPPPGRPAPEDESAAAGSEEVTADEQDSERLEADEGERQSAPPPSPRLPTPLASPRLPTPPPSPRLPTPLASPRLPTPLASPRLPTPPPSPRLPTPPPSPPPPPAVIVSKKSDELDAELLEPIELEAAPERAELSDEIPIFLVTEPGAAAPSPGRPPAIAAPAPPAAVLALPDRVSRATRGAARSLLVGIDFGTSMSSLAVVRDREVHVLRTPCGRFEIPSVVAFDGERVLVGTGACERLASDPPSAIASPKRLLGRRHDERELEPFLSTLAMAHTRGPGGEVMLQSGRRRVRVEEVCAAVIGYLRELAERQFGEPIREAVFTVPVSFDQRRCDALAEAARMAGLRVLATVDEPTAAALTYLDDPSYRNLVAVYDFGGGTFDFSVLDVSAADVQVIATAGDTWLGGDDLDEALAGAAANGFWRTHSIELRHQAVQWQRLRLAAEKTKRELSRGDAAVLELRAAALARQGPLDLRFPVTRQAFAGLVQPIIQRSLDTCQEALALCELAPSQLHAVYLSGGSCYVPAVREAVAKFFGQPPKVVVPPERAVVMGAAIHAARHLSGQIQLSEARMQVAR